jgi:MYXO-CTERM domain-containing protein
MSRTFWRLCAVGLAVISLICVVWRFSLGATEETTPLQWALQIGLLASLGLGLLALRRARRRPKAGEWRGR